MIVPSTELAELLQGYRRFREHGWSPERERWASLREGQEPRVMVIACSDSRVDPAQIFDVRPGEIFVVRNVANLMPPYEPDGHYHSTSAALEFAVQSLRVSDIVVMGHGRCGGITAALDPDAEPLSPGDFIGRWMHLLRPAAEQILKDFGKIDILVNNAGATWGAPAEDHPVEAWDKLVSVNLTGAFVLTQLIGKRSMIPARWGRIVNIA